MKVLNEKAKVLKVLFFALVFGWAGSFLTCSGFPKISTKPVENFNLEKFLGDWYEIGRFDFTWEKNLKEVKASYSLNKDGSIKVVNSGFNYVKDKAVQSVGKAKFVDARKNNGDLKVAFFGPFYSGYRIISVDSGENDPEYKYALVAGNSSKLLWILSRTPVIPDEVKNNYIRIAESAGYDLQNFVWTVQ